MRYEHKKFTARLIAILNQFLRGITTRTPKPSLAARLAAETTLRNERDLLNAILDTTVQAIVVLSREGQIIFANNQVEAVLGLTRNAATNLGYNSSEWHHTDIDGGPWPDERQPFRRVMETGEPVFDVQHGIEWPDGRRKILSINGAPIKDHTGQISSVVFAITDITERKRAEVMLRESEERLRALIRDINIGLSLHGPDGQLILCNPAACAILGLSEDELIGYQFGSLAWAPIDESGQPYNRRDLAIFRAIESGQTVHNQVVGLRTKSDHKRVWLLLNAAPQFEADGSLRYVITSFSDISERRRLEEQLRHSQKMEAVGRLAGGIAHDFNNILTVIAGSCDMLLADAGALPDNARQDLEQIRQSSQRAADLTHQLLSFSRQQILQPKLLNLSHVLDNLERMLRRLIGEDIKLEVNLAPELWPICADPSHIEQVVMNLVVNARDAMPEGGLLTITATNVTVYPEAATAPVDLTPGEYLLLSVSDTGTGIAEEHRPYIFEPFYTTKPQGKGTGLGLAMVHGIVAQSGGTITFTSKIGEGTRFEIYLPRAQNGELPEVTEVAARLDDLGNETVLLVEDEAMVRQLLTRILMQRGYTVIAATDGEEALQLMRDAAPAVDLLITDMVMPGGLNGLQLATALKAIRPGLKVIYISGYADAQLGPGEALVEGAIFLAKPFSPELLARTVRTILNE